VKYNWLYRTAGYTYGFYGRNCCSWHSS